MSNIIDIKVEWLRAEQQYVATADMGDCGLMGAGATPREAIEALMSQYDGYQSSLNNGI